MRLAVLASGSGTLLDAMASDGLPIELVVVDRRCQVEDVADRHGITCVVLERTDFGDGFERDAFTDRVVATLVEHRIDLVAMAGWGTILGPAAFAALPGRIVNTHPALLPAFPGWHAVRDALAAGVKVTGCTVHVATETVDDGPILAQEAVPVLPDDDESTLHERIKIVERRIYTDTIRSLLDRDAVADANADAVGGPGPERDAVADANADAVGGEPSPAAAPDHDRVPAAAAPDITPRTAP